jgi:hypothetical protein
MHILNRKSQILFIGVVLSLVLVACNVGNNSQSTNSSTTGTPTATPTANSARSSNANITSVTKDNMVFFYPNYYVEFANVNLDINYVSKEKNKLGGGNTIGAKKSTITTVVNTASADDCKQLAEQITQATTGASVISSNPFLTNNIPGCYYKLKMDVQGLSFFNENRTFFKVNNSQTDVYTVASLYQTDAKQSEIQDLQDALNAFAL